MKKLFILLAALALLLCACTPVTQQPGTNAPDETTVPDETTAPPETTMPNETTAPRQPRQPDALFEVIWNTYPNKPEEITTWKAYLETSEYWRVFRYTGELAEHPGEVTIDTSAMDIDLVYFVDFETGKIVQITDSPALTIPFATSEHIYYVLESEPTKVWRCDYAGENRTVVYESEYGAVTHLQFYGSDAGGKLILCEDRNRIVSYDMATGELYVLMEAYRINQFYYSPSSLYDFDFVNQLYEDELGPLIFWTGALNEGDADCSYYYLVSEGRHWDNVTWECINVSVTVPGYTIPDDVDPETTVPDESTAPNETTTEPAPTPIQILGTNEDGIPIVDGIDLNHSSNGFFWDRSGSTVISIHNGEIEMPEIHEASVTLTHWEQNFEFNFKWCSNAGEVGIYESSGCSVSPIPGNDEFVRLDIDYENKHRYVYLLELSTLRLWNPLGAVDDTLEPDMFMFDFSSDLRHVLFNVGDITYILDTETDTVTSIAELTGFEGNVGVGFVNDSLLSILYVEGTIPQEWYADCYTYDLTDGSTCTLYTDTYYGWLADVGGIDAFGRVHVHIHDVDSGICIVDCVTGTHSLTGIPDVLWAQSCGAENVFIRSWSEPIVYLVEPDGTATPVFQFD